MVRKTEIVIMGLLIVAAIVLSCFAYKSIANGDSYMGQEMRKQRAVDFCEKKGWGYHTSYNEEAGTIWCGARDGNGFDGITYNARKGFFGELRLNDLNLVENEQ